MKELYLGEAVRQQRLALGLTQEEVCEGICEPITISRFENGKQTPSRNRIIAILQRLGMPSDRFYALLSAKETELADIEKEITSCHVRFERASREEKRAIREEIAVENVNFAYGDKPVLKNASFRFEKGGKYALTGPSGCGKSTLLKLILGWLPEYSGTIKFDDRDAREFTPEQLQRQMSYIEQDVYLFNSTIRENITLGEKFSGEEIARALRGSALDADLAQMPLGIDTPVGEDGSNLSGGQKQRVAIARALIHGRSILLVDEGTSALDKKNADIVEQSLLADDELTLILVSHHLSPERRTQFTEVYEMETAAV